MGACKQRITKLRGLRVKSTRGLSNLTRGEFTKLTGISSATLQSWEDGKAGGLTLKGALKLQSAFDKLGIKVFSNYLLNGGGLPPVNLALSSSCNPANIIYNIEKDLEDLVNKYARFVKVSKL